MTWKALDLHGRWPNKWAAVTSLGPRGRGAEGVSRPRGQILNADHWVWFPTHSAGGGIFSSGLIRRNSIRNTVQAHHKHIPRQRNGHHSRAGRTLRQRERPAAPFAVQLKVQRGDSWRCV